MAKFSLLLACSLFIGCQAPATHVTRYEPRAVTGPHRTAFLVVSKNQRRGTEEDAPLVSSTPHAVIAFLNAPTISREASRFALAPEITPETTHHASITKHRAEIDHLEFDLARGSLLVLANSPGEALTVVHQGSIPQALDEPIFVQLQVELLADHVVAKSR